jgi:hypothetical protein
VILSPKYLANPSEVNGSTRPIIEKLATKKGNSERIYRNTMLFLVCSELGIGKLQEDIKNFIACQKISNDYASQLTSEQKKDIGRRIEEASKQSDVSLVSAYSIVVKYSVKNGVETLIMKQYKDSLDNQINSNVISTLKEEEWLLESVGLGTLKNNNLLPVPGQSLRAKDVYEAFLRFDDKPMITGAEAVAKSLQKYCYNGEFCIATGDGTTFTRFYFQESIPFFEVTDVTNWLVDKSLKPQATQPQPSTPAGTPEFSYSPAEQSNIPTAELEQGTPAVKALKALIISGKVHVDQYHELLTCFIAPFAMNGYKLDIDVKFKIKATPNSPLDESKQQYKSAKEAAKQLGLSFEEEV